MGRPYTADFNGVAVTVAQDLFELVCPSDAVVKVTEFHLGQVTEIADAQEEQFLVQVKRGEGTVTSGSGGSTPTARPLEKGDPAYGGTVEANNTTKMATGTGAIVTLFSFQWNVRQPLDIYFTPEMCPIITPSDRLTIELGAAPADSITMQGSIGFEEIGG